MRRDGLGEPATYGEVNPPVFVEAFVFPRPELGTASLPRAQRGGGRTDRTSSSGVARIALGRFCRPPRRVAVVETRKEVLKLPTREVIRTLKE